MNDLETYIRRRASELGYDPDAVMAMVMGEGGVTDPVNRSRGHDASIGGREESYGPFQMNMRGGLGERLLRERGIDVRDPANVYKGVDYALERAGVEGWIPWLNTMKKLGYDKWTGLRQAGGKGMRHVGGAGSSPEYFAPKGTTAAPAATPPPAQYELKPEKKKTAAEHMGEAVSKLGDYEVGMGDAPGMPPVQFYGGEAIPSVMRLPFQPIQAGGQPDLRALLASLMGGGGARA